MKISISVESPVENKEAASFIRELTGCALSTAQKRLAQGKGGFFYTTELFLNDYVERAEEILRLIDVFMRLNINLFIIEIGHDESWESVDMNRLDDYRLETSVLYNTVISTKDKYK